MDTYGTHDCLPDPQDDVDLDEYTCDCGEEKRLEEDRCPACEQDRLDNIREAAEEHERDRLQSEAEDRAAESPLFMLACDLARLSAGRLS